MGTCLQMIWNANKTLMTRLVFTKFAGRNCVLRPHRIWDIVHDQLFPTGRDSKAIWDLIWCVIWHHRQFETNTDLLSFWMSKWRSPLKRLRKESERRLTHHSHEKRILRANFLVSSGNNNETKKSSINAGCTSISVANLFRMNFDIWPSEAAKLADIIQYLGLHYNVDFSY